MGAGDAVVPEHPPPLGTAPQSPAPPTLAVPVPIMGKDVTEWVPRPSGDTVVDAVQFWEDGVGLPYSKVARAFRKEGVTRVPWQLVDGDRLRWGVSSVLAQRWDLLCCS